MKFSQKHNLASIADLIQVSYKGPADLAVTGINEIHRVEAGDIVFVDHPKYYDKALNSAASVVLINKEVDVPEGKGILICEEPFTKFNEILAHFRPFHFPNGEKGENVFVGKNTKVHSSVVIGNNVHIGENCQIFPHVSIGDDVQIGDNVIIQSGTVIGSFGFYYKNRPGHFERLLSCGTVEIENDVEIGANCTIDKGVTSRTRIGAGTKMDNLVQIGHDTEIGKKCLIAAGCGIAGCVKIGNEVTIWGQVGITSGIEIGDKVVLQAKSGISKSLEGGKVYFGAPAEEARLKLKEMALIRRLPELFQKLTENDR